MKKILIILTGILIASQSFGQLSIFPNDSNKFLERINLAAGKYIYYNGVKLNLTHVGQPQSGILLWDSVTRVYKPYPTRAEVGTDAKIFQDGSNLIPSSNHSNIISCNFALYTGSGNSSYTGYGTYNSSYGGTACRSISTTSFGSYSTSTSGVANRGNSGSGIGGSFSSNTGSCMEVYSSATLTANKTARIAYIWRNEVASSYNITGTLLDLYDNPSFTTGVNTGRTISATIGTVDRFWIYPRVANGASAVAYLFDTHTNLTNATAKLISVRDSGVEKASIDYAGNINITSGARYLRNGIPIQRPLADFYTDASTSGIGETDLYSYTVPANTLANNGDKIIATYTVIGDATATGHVEPYFAETNLASDLINVLNNDIMRLNIEIIRVSSSVARCTITAGQAGNYTYVTYIELTSKDWTTTNILKITGTAAAGTITAKMGYVEYKPLAQ